MLKDEQLKKQYYDALLEKDVAYDGLFFVGIKTTGIFCHATCPARKPKYENCEFFQQAEEALLAGYRPCKRCHPLTYPNELSPVVKELVQMIEKNPEKRWTDANFKALGIHAATARRQFKKIYGMTFVQYARARRMGIAMEQIRKGQNILPTQLDVGYDSTSGFHDAFSKIMGETPKKSKEILTLYAEWFDTQLGPMLSICDETYVYLLEFVDRRGLEREIERLRKRLHTVILPGTTNISREVITQVTDYFAGKNFVFSLPLYYLGSDFQKYVWHMLEKIPAGETISYKELAASIGNINASRAVANANGANQLAIIIPCHRVIQSNGELGGYGGGISRKQWLLEHERKYEL